MIISFLFQRKTGRTESFW